MTFVKSFCIQLDDAAKLASSALAESNTEVIGLRAENMRLKDKATEQENSITELMQKVEDAHHQATTTSNQIMVNKAEIMTEVAKLVEDMRAKHASELLAATQAAESATQQHALEKAALTKEIERLCQEVEEYEEWWHETAAAEDPHDGAQYFDVADEEDQADEWNEEGQE